MSVQTLPQIRWQFTEHQDGGHPFWTWTRFHLNGRAETQSESFPNYGEAIYDAIRKGFQPRSESWGVTSSAGLTSFFNIDPSVQNGPQDFNTNPRVSQPLPRAQSPPKNQPKRKGR